MRLSDLLRPRGRKQSQGAPQLAAQDRAERVLVDGFRLLSRLFTRAADLIETQRLQRRGFEPQGKWLERLDEPGGMNGKNSSSRQR